MWGSLMPPSKTDKKKPKKTDEPLKENEKVGHEVSLAEKLRWVIEDSNKPLFCPRCGANHEHLNIQECLKDKWDPEGSQYVSVSYDMHCKRCGWCGDISPDLTLDIPQGEESK